MRSRLPLLACTLALVDGAPLLFDRAPNAAAATLVAPAGGATVASARPSFTWTLGAGETANVLCDTQDIAPDGSTGACELLHTGLTPRAVSLRAPRDLMAGRHAWHLWHTTGGGELVKSAAAQYVVPIALGGVRIDARATRFARAAATLTSTVRWSSNTRHGPRVKVTWTVRTPRRVLCRRTELRHRTSAHAHTIRCRIRAAHAPRGTRVTVTATLAHRKFVRTARRTIVAPGSRP